ncbi:LysR family transcriptional regulator [Streptomyces sp. NPDC056149]|uniref:LysR family transcriptional regulator n=1 Tax=unclassified Streptomyces TaxID=2593676 RepID=UPI002381731B|nr:LysR family transcriptional regulator [Streptomyces sp. WZ-12]
MDLLAHLEAYVAAVDEASFSRAADRLGIAQPLLSRRIKTLETHFGDLLFDRSRRQVAVTDFGLLLLPYAKDVLDRAQRLQQVARSATRSAIRAVGVPADCGPAALARVIRAGTEHDLPLGVHELPPDERVSGLADGTLAYALLRVPPGNAALRVPLGLASAPPSDASSGASSGALAGPIPGQAAAGVQARRRVIHLEDLRPARDRRAAGERPASVPILTTAEDHVPYLRDRLGRAAARAGLPEGLIRPAGSLATALAETLAGRATLLCTEPFARQHGAEWAPLGDASLHRGYDPGAARRRADAAEVPGWLVAQLADAVGAAPPGPAGVRTTAVGEHAPALLAARG